LETPSNGNQRTFTHVGSISVIMLTAEECAPRAIALTSELSIGYNLAWQDSASFNHGGI
jgi:hypothetical protein